MSIQRTHSTFASHFGRILARSRVVAITCIDILYGSDIHTPTHLIRRRSTGLQAGSNEQLHSQSQQRPNPWLFVGLGNLRERQGNYQKAAELYKRAIEEGERDGISYNNLAWLTALKRRQGSKKLSTTPTTPLLSSRIRPIFSTREALST